MHDVMAGINSGNLLHSTIRRDDSKSIGGAGAVSMALVAEGRTGIETSNGVRVCVGESFGVSTYAGSSVASGAHAAKRKNAAIRMSGIERFKATACLHIEFERNFLVSSILSLFTFPFSSQYSSN